MDVCPSIDKPTLDRNTNNRGRLGQCVPNSRHNRSGLAETRPKFPDIVANSDHFATGMVAQPCGSLPLCRARVSTRVKPRAPEKPKFDRHRAGFGRSLACCGPTLVAVVLNFFDPGPNSAEFVRHLVDAGPNEMDPRPSVAEFGRFQPNIGRRRPNFGRCRAEVRPSIGRSRPRYLALTSGQICPDENNTVVVMLARKREELKTSNSDQKRKRRRKMRKRRRKTRNRKGKDDDDE